MYVVLHEVQPETWRQVGTSEAGNAADAIREVSEGADAEPISGAFVAVPGRSWNPLTLRYETVTRAVWEPSGEAEASSFEAPTEIVPPDAA